MLIEIGGHTKKTPFFMFREIIEKINEHLCEGIQNHIGAITIEEVALKLGTNQNDPYDWGKTDGEFSQTLESFNKLWNRAFSNSGTIEDSQVYTMLTVLTLMEIWDSHYKPTNL